MKITKVKPTDRILRWRPDVKYRAEITTQEAKETEFPDGTTVWYNSNVGTFGIGLRSY